MKKSIIFIISALLLVQSAFAPGQDNDPITGTLSFGELNLPTGIVTGYNLTMDSGFISVLGVRSSVVYFPLTQNVLEPKFYKKILDGDIVEFEVPLNEEEFRITSISGDVSEVVVNRLPYLIGYGDTSELNLLDAGYQGSMYALVFGREVSNGAMSINNNPGKAIYLSNSANGQILFLKDDNTILSLDVEGNNVISFRAPSQVGGNDQVSESERIERAGAVVDIATEGCTDDDSDEANQYSVSSFGFDESGAFLNDFCASEPRTGRKILNEVKCNAESHVYLEEYQCPAGEVCRSGACQPEQRAEVAFCYDSDLNGQSGLDSNAVNRLADSFSSKGVVAGFYAAGQDVSYGLWDDSCSTDTKLVEYFCRAQKTRFATIVCGSGCSEGKCASPPYCFDSDGGENFETRGNTLEITAGSNGQTSLRASANSQNLASLRRTDECTNVNDLKEYSCDNNGRIKDQISVCERGCIQGRCIRPTENIDAKLCESRSDCNFSQACVNGFCGLCSRTQDCGSGWVCQNSRCKPSSGRCRTNINCKINQYCERDADENLGYCRNERLSSLAEIRSALERRWERINVYAKVIARFEGLHGIATPQKLPNGQNCLVNAQCFSDYCNPQAGKCELAPNAIVGGDTMELKLNGETCTSNAQCQSNVCGQYGSKKYCGLMLNFDCQANAACGSLYCLKNPANAQFGRCAQKANNAACAKNSECQSNYCGYADPAVPVKTCKAMPAGNLNMLDPNTPGMPDYTAAGNNFGDANNMPRI